MADVLYINGRYTTTDEKVIGVEDRGFQFGDGCYEVLKFLRRRPIFLDNHYRRLAQGLNELEIRHPWTEIEFEAMCRQLLDRTEFADGIIYVQVTRGEAERAHFYPEEVDPTAVVYTRRFAFPNEMTKDRGIKVITTPDIRWKHCDVKSVNLLGNVIAKKKAQRAGAEEALLIEDAEVKEGASSSFFAVREGKLITHPSDAHILAGTVRDYVISIALAEKIRVAERPVRDYELLTLDEAFITSTTQGVMPVTEIDGRVIANSRRGEVTARLQQLYDELEMKHTLETIAERQ